MKKLLFLFLLFVPFQFTKAQNEFLSGYQSESTIYLKDGSFVEGLVKLDKKGFDYDSYDVIKFKKNSESKKIVYDYSSVERVFLNDIEGEEVILDYISSDKYKHPQLLLLVIEDDLSLYQTFQYNYIRNSFYPSDYHLTNRTKNEHTQSLADISYFIKKENSSKAKFCLTSKLTSKKKFRQSITEYLDTCPELIEKINNRQFQPKDLLQIVDFFNDFCSIY